MYRVWRAITKFAELQQHVLHEFNKVCEEDAFILV